MPIYKNIKRADLADNLDDAIKALAKAKELCETESDEDVDRNSLFQEVASAWHVVNDMHESLDEGMEIW